MAVDRPENGFLEFRRCPTSRFRGVRSLSQKCRFPCLAAFAGLVLLSVPGVGERLTVGGRVLDSAGEDLAGVVVRLVQRPSGCDTDWTRPQDGTVDSTTTSESGFFSLTAPGAGLWDVLAERDGYVAAAYSLQPLLSHAELPTLRMLPAAALEIGVEGDPGSSLPAVRWKVLQSSRGTLYRFWKAAPRAGISFAEGRFRLPLASGESVTIAVAADGYEEAVLEAGVEASEEAVSLKRLTTRARKIAVLDHLHQPMRAAQVGLGEMAWPAGATDEEGLTAAVTLAIYTPVRVTTPEGRVFEEELHAGDSDKSAPGDVEEALTVLLPPPVEISGTVVGAITLAPLAQALIIVRQRMPPWRKEGHDREVVHLVQAGARGDFHLSTLFTSNLEIEAFAPGFLSSSVKVTAPKDEQMFVLEPAARIEGIVVDPAGEPLSEVEVIALFDRDLVPPSRPPYRARSGPTGRFVLDPVNPDASFILEATRDGYSPERMTLTSPAPGDALSDLKIVLGGTVSVHGKVVDERNRPVEGAVVRLSPQTNPDLLSLARTSRPRSTQPRTTATDDQGVFGLASLPAGPYDLRIDALDFAVSQARGVELSSDGSPVDLGTWVLERGFSIEGIVTDTEDRLLEGCTILIKGADVYSREAATTRLRGGDGGLTVSVQDVGARTGRDGRFALDHLAPGNPVDLIFEKDGFASSELTGISEPPDEELTIVLDPLAELGGRVTDESNKPIPDAEVTIFMDRLRVETTRTDPGGMFRFSALDPGILRMRVTASGYLRWDRRAQVGKGTLDRLDVRLVRASVLEGRVFDAEGLPAPAAKVSVDEFRAWSDDTGRYRLELSPGLNDVTVSYQARRMTRRIEIFETQATRWDFYLEPGYDISGRVVDQVGDPIAGAHLILQSEANFGESGYIEAEIRSDATGSFRFADCSSGTYRLVALKPGLATDRMSGLEVVDAPLLGLEIVLSSGASLIGRVIGLSEDQLGRIQITASSGPGVMKRGSVDHQGSYRLDRLAAGEWEVVAQVRLEGRWIRRTIRLEPGEQETVLDLDFSESGLELAAQLSVDGEPAAGWAAILTAAAGNGTGGGLVLENRTDYRGGVVFDGLSEGRYMLLAGRSSGAGRELHHGSSLVEVLDLDESTEIRLDTRTASLNGIVTDQIGIPIAAEVWLEQLGPEGEILRPRSQVAQADQQGTFTLPYLLPGVYQLTLEASGSKSASLLINLKFGESRQLTIALASN